MSIEGLNKATANMPMGNEWINSSGALAGGPNTDNRGFKFEYTETASGELIHVGSNSTVIFDSDKSNTKSGKGFAQAWVSWVGSGDMSVISSYNVSGVTRTSQGKYKITFEPGTFSTTQYVAIGNSNSRSSAENPEDFTVNTVGIVERTPDYLTFCVLSDNDEEFVNAALNDLVVFGNTAGVTAQSVRSINT